MPRLVYSQPKEWGLRFNGTSQGAQTGSTLNLSTTNKITLTYWVKRNAVQGALAAIAELSESYGLYSDTFLSVLSTSGNAAFAIVGNGGNTEWYTQPLAIGKWYFVAFSCDLSLSSASAIKGYINGIQNVSSTISTGPTPVGGNFGNRLFNIGARNNAASLHSNVSIKDMRIYGSILNSTQIQQIYQNGPNIAFGSPLAWYKMNEGTNTTITDSGSLATNASITGRTITGTTPATMWAIDPVRPPKVALTDSNISIQLNGTSDRIVIADNDVLDFGTGDFTVECKVQFRKTGYNFLVDKINVGSVGWQLFSNETLVNALNRVSMWIQTSGPNYFAVSCFNRINYGQWYHIIASVTRNDVTQLKIFMNGIHDPVYSGGAAYSGVTGTVSTAVALDIGHRQNASPLWLGGNIYDVRLYNRALTDDECLSRYYTNENITSGRVGWWKIGEGTGTTITDSQGSNPGTLTGGTWSNQTL